MASNPRWLSESKTVQSASKNSMSNFPRWNRVYRKAATLSDPRRPKTTCYYKLKRWNVVFLRESFNLTTYFYLGQSLRRWLLCSTHITVDIGVATRLVQLWLIKDPYYGKTGVIPERPEKVSKTTMQGNRKFEKTSSQIASGNWSLCWEQPSCKQFFNQISRT